MKHSPSPREIWAAVVTAAILLLAISCAVPLAPSYQILKQTFEVQFVPGTTPELRIHNVYTLQNSGTAPLAFIDVVFPNAKTYGRTKLQTQLAGQAVTPQNLPEEYQEESPDALRLPLASSWAQKERRELVVDYTLEPAASADPQAAEGFHLGTRGWLPVFLPPNHILSSAPIRPPTMSYTVKVPSTFVIVARGSAAGRKQDGTATIYRFNLGKDDLAPYIVAGRYLSSSETKKSGDAIFWTTQPLAANTGAAQQRFASAWSVLQKNFGQVNKRDTEPYIVESQAFAFESADPSSGAFVSFPGGAFVSHAALVSGTGSNDFVTRNERALARTWFGDALTPASSAGVALGEGLPAYATIVIDEAIEGQSARQADVADLLQVYDDARGQLKIAENSVVTTLPADSPEQRRIAKAKAPLLFIALEDSCGETDVRQGIAEAIQLLRGKEVSVNDLRAAIEYTCGKSLAEPFRAWLYNPGIPAGFRAHYGQVEENRK